MATTETTTINLSHDITTNGKTFKKGQGVIVPKDMADDLVRRDYEYQQYLNNLHVKRTSEVNAGSIAAGGGAE